MMKVFQQINKKTKKTKFTSKAIIKAQRRLTGIFQSKVFLSYILKLF